MREDRTKEEELKSDRKEGKERERKKLKEWSRNSNNTERKTPWIISYTTVDQEKIKQRRKSVQARKKRLERKQDVNVLYVKRSEDDVSVPLSDSETWKCSRRESFHNLRLIHITWGNHWSTDFLRNNRLRWLRLWWTKRQVLLRKLWAWRRNCFCLVCKGPEKL